MPLVSSVLPWQPNAGAHLLPEAAARDERRLWAVRCSAVLGQSPHIDKRPLMILESVFPPAFSITVPEAFPPANPLRRSPNPS